MHDIDTAVEMYLEPFQPYMIELFTKIVNGSRIKKVLSYITDMFLNMRCSYRDSI